jgi:ribosome-associated protein
MISSMHALPSNELHFSFVRSGGPGGQNVNKVATKVRLVWNIGTSGAFFDEEKRLIREGTRAYLTENDEIVIQVSDTRSQAQNKKLAIARLERLVARALVKKKKRRVPRPSKSSVEQRLSNKRHTRQKKARRSLEGMWKET